VRSVKIFGIKKATSEDVAKGSIDWIRIIYMILDPYIKHTGLKSLDS